MESGPLVDAGSEIPKGSGPDFTIPHAQEYLVPKISALSGQDTRLNRRI
jgi:hypothetical protein